MSDGSIRASDDDRERVVAVLREAYSEGRLTLDEFEERTSVAYAARTWGELRELTVDLPSRPTFSLAEIDAADSDSRDRELRDRELREKELSDRASADQPMSPMARDLMRPVPRHPRPFSRLLPVIFIWVVIAASAGASHLAVALGIVFVAIFGIRVMSSRRW
jgi:hypothetical protein